MDLDKAIQGRKSVRHFAAKKPSWKDILECIDATRYAPMAGNIFPLKFIVVDDKATIQKLSEASQQEFIATAPYVVVVCTDPTLVLNAYPDFAIKFCRQQAGAAIENFLLKLEEKSLKTCWIGYFVESLIMQALDIPSTMTIEALFPIGLEAKKPGTARKERTKIDINRILFFDKWGNRRMKDIKKLDV